MTILTSAVDDFRIIRFASDVEASEVDVVDGWSHWVEFRDGDRLEG